MNDKLLAPWQVGCYDPRYVFDRHGEEVAHVHNNYELAVPQARVMAAAPDLLDACKGLLAFMEQYDLLDWDLADDDRARIDEAHAAIAKATGDK